MKFSEALEPKPKKKTPPPAIAKGLDLEAAKKRFAYVHQEIDKLKTDAEVAVVQDESGLKAAVSMTKAVKELDKKITAQRKETIAAADKFVRTVNTFCRDFTSKLQTIEKTLKKKIGDYQYRQELARREAERKAQEEARKLQEDLDKEAEKKGVEKVEVTTPVMPKQDLVARTEDGASAHIRMEWTVDVINEDEVPREYCSSDSSKLKAAAKAGVREIRGCKIYEKPIPVIR
jgi:hypothetical protein